MGELEKMAAIKAESQVIGQYLEWLDEEGYAVCRLDTRNDTHYNEWRPVTGTIEQRLAGYFDIDLVKAEKEKQALLDEFRMMQNNHGIK